MLFQNFCKLNIFRCTKLQQKLRHQSLGYVNNKSDVNLGDSGNKTCQIILRGMVSCFNSN